MTRSAEGQIMTFAELTDGDWCYNWWQLGSRIWEVTLVCVWPALFLVLAYHHTVSLSWVGASWRVLCS